MNEVLLAVIASSALAVAVLALALVIGALSRLNRLESSGVAMPTFGLAIGEDVPHEALESRFGDQARIALDAASLWVFASSSCQACQELVANLNLEAAEVSRSNLHMVTPSKADVDSLEADSDFDASWIVDTSGELRSGFGALATPMAFLVRDGRVVDRELGPELGRLLVAAATAGREQ